MSLKLALWLLVLAAGVGTSQTDQRINPGFGGLEGQVIDSQTRLPVSKAKVLLEPDDGAADGKLISTLSDTQGKFYISNVIPGKYVVPAAKEDEGYPNADNAAFAADLTALPRVLVREGEVTRDVVIRIEKGGKILGLILDAESRQPIVNSRVRLTRVDDPKLWIEAGPDEVGRFQFIIPARPFHLEVSAPGYRTWSFTRHDEAAEEILLLKPESIEHITIALKKVNGDLGAWKIGL